MPQWIRVLAAILVAFCAAAILISPAAELPDFTTAVKAASAIGHAHAAALHVLLPSAQTIQFGTVLVDVRHRPTLPIRFQALLSLTCALLC